MYKLQTSKGFKGMASQFLFCLLIIIISGAFAWIQQTSPVNEEGIVSFSESLTGGGGNCTEYRGKGTFSGLNFSIYFKSNGDSKAWASDMLIILFAGTKCYTYGGYDDDDVSIHKLNGAYRFPHIKFIAANP